MGSSKNYYNGILKELKKGVPSLFFFFFLCINFINSLYIYMYTYLTFAYSSKTTDSDSSSQRPTMAPSSSSIT